MKIQKYINVYFFWIASIYLAVLDIFHVFGAFFLEVCYIY